MIGIDGSVRVLVAAKPVDFRKGMDGLAALVQQQLVVDRPAHHHGFRRAPHDAVAVGNLDGQIARISGSDPSHSLLTGRGVHTPHPCFGESNQNVVNVLNDPLLFGVDEIAKAAGFLTKFRLTGRTQLESRHQFEREERGGD